MSTRVLFFSDFVCPYCYVAETGVLGRLIEEYEIELDWRGFQLHPATPRGGIALGQLLRGADVTVMQAQMKAFAATFGVRMGQPAHVANTRRALAAAEHARDAGQLHPFRHAVMDAYWNCGQDIELDNTLAGAATSAGLDPAALVAAADDPAMQARVDEMGAEAAKWGVTGVPTYFLLPDGWGLDQPPPAPDAPHPVRVVGCQPWESVVVAARRAGAKLRA